MQCLLTYVKPAKKRLNRLKRRATAQQKTIKTFPTIFWLRCTIQTRRLCYKQPESGERNLTNL
jgi:hypothetical protein